MEWQRMGWTGYSDDTSLIEAGWIHLTDCSQNCLPGTARPSSRLTALVSPIRIFNRPTTFLWTSLRGSCSPFFWYSCFPLLLRLVFLDFFWLRLRGSCSPPSFQPGTRVSLFRFFGIPFSSRLGFVPHFIVPCAFRFRVFRFGFSSILLWGSCSPPASWTLLACFGTRVSHLLCLHYRGSCSSIFLWLRLRNSCFPLSLHLGTRDPAFDFMAPFNFLWGSCSPLSVLHVSGLIFLALDTSPSFLGLVFPTL